MPMLFTRRNPHHVPPTYLADRTSPGLDPADAGDDVERLPQRMGMPIRPRPRLEGDAVRSTPRRGFGHNDRILLDGAHKILLRRPAGRARAGEMDIHGVLLRY